jgi:hypothetical protein
LFADLRNWTRFVESPNFNLCLFAFNQVFGEDKRLSLGAAKFQVEQHEKNPTTFESRI